MQPFAIVSAPERRHRRARARAEEGGARRRSARTQLRELARLGDDLEERLGGPQDIEWAIEGGELYVLQARPVTA